MPPPRAPTTTLVPPPLPIPVASQSSRYLTPTTNPIPLLSTTISQTYSAAHTGLIVLYYYFRSRALVADPLTTLIWDLVPVAVAQAVFCAACLPAAGSWNNGTEGGKILEGTATTKTSRASKTPNFAAGGGLKKKTGGKGTTAGEKDGAGGSWGSRVMPTFLSLILTLTLPPIPLTVLVLCMGAPLYPTSLLPHTILLALHVSVLAFLPIFYTHGVSPLAWRDVFAAWLPFDEAGVWAGTVGAMVGGWIGAIPIALDWDREWQKWPCTIIWGVVLGWAVGRILTSGQPAGFKFGAGARIDMSETVEIPEELRPNIEQMKKKD